MSRLTINIPDQLRERLAEASESSGISETDLAKAMLTAGLDQFEGGGLVLKASVPSRKTVAEKFGMEGKAA